MTKQADYLWVRNEYFVPTMAYALIRVDDRHIINGLKSDIDHKVRNDLHNTPCLMFYNTKVINGELRVLFRVDCFALSFYFGRRCNSAPHFPNNNIEYRGIINFDKIKMVTDWGEPKPYDLN